MRIVVLCVHMCVECVLRARVCTAVVLCVHVCVEYVLRARVCTAVCCLCVCARTALSSVCVWRARLWECVCLSVLVCAGVGERCWWAGVCMLSVCVCYSCACARVLEVCYVCVPSCVCRSRACAVVRVWAWWCLRARGG